VVDGRHLMSAPDEPPFSRVGQNRNYIPYVTVCMMISLLKMQRTYATVYIRKYVWFWPILPSSNVMTQVKLAVLPPPAE